MRKIGSARISNMEVLWEAVRSFGAKKSAELKAGLYWSSFEIIHEWTLQINYWDPE